VVLLPGAETAMEKYLSRVIAYVFWHWRKTGIPANEYEKRQKGFHAALSAAPPPGFFNSVSVGVAGLPWTAGEEAYEDWYLVESFAALGFLNEQAVSGSRAEPHDAAAAVAEDGAAGIYSLQHGEALSRPKHSHWLGKPAGMGYKECLAQLLPLTDEVHGALWLRQMALGPAMELCLQAGRPVTFPAAFKVLQRPLRRIWPIEP
jgi:hypothetical protein